MRQNIAFCYICHLSPTVDLVLTECTLVGLQRTMPVHINTCDNLLIQKYVHRRPCTDCRAKTKLCAYHVTCKEADVRKQTRSVMWIWIRIVTAWLLCFNVYRCPHSDQWNSKKTTENNLLCPFGISYGFCNFKVRLILLKLVFDDFIYLKCSYNVKFFSR